MRRLNLQRFLFLITLVALLAVVAGFAYIEMMRLRLAPIVTWQSERINMIATEMNREMGHVRVLAGLLKNSGAVSNALDRNHAIDKEALSQTFIRFGRGNHNVSQVRWLDNEGVEQVRVNIKRGDYKQVPDDELQNKQTRYYFYKTMRMGANQVYISPLDLNIENGMPVVPFEPTLRAGIRTGFGDTLHTGSLIINFNFAQFFDRLRQMHGENSQLQMVNYQGYWMLNSHPDKEWGNMLGNPDTNLIHEDPQLWQELHSQRTILGEIIHGRVISSFRINDDMNVAGSPPEHSIWIIAQTRDGVLKQIRLEVIAQVMVGTFIVGVLGVILLLRIGRAERAREVLLAQVRKERDALEHAYRELSTAHTRQQELQDELVESRKLSALGMMVAGVAHELNTPVGGALMLVSGLKKQVDKLAVMNADEAFQKGIVRLKQGIDLAEINLQKSSSLIKSFKRTAYDRVAPERSLFLLKQTVDDLLLTLNPRIKHTHISVKTDIPEDLKLNSFSGIISQILQNLIDNALAHAFDANATGTITVTAHTLSEHEPQLILEVSDDGKGVKAEMKNSLFDPFITSKRGDGHNGLGLHMVQQWVANSLHGTIKVQSEEGKGTTFTIRIPLITRTEDEPTTPESDNSDKTD